MTQSEYHGAWNRGCMTDLSGDGAVFLKGADARDLLQRMTTNDIRNLDESRAVPTIFTTEKGRVIDRVLLLKLGAGILMLPGPGTREKLIRWIEKYTIMEDVRCTDVTSSRIRLFIGGPKAREFLMNALSVKSLPERLYEAAVLRSGTAEWIVIKSEPMCGDGYLALGDRGSEESMAGFIGAAVSEGMVKLSSGAAELLRIEHGYPAAGKELTEEINPLEASLEDAISFTKGCYIGQEVIARLTTYKKVQRTLFGIEVKSDVLCETKSPLMIEGNEAGWVTSMSIHPATGRAIGLGFVRKEFAAAGRDIEIRSGSTCVQGKIVKLPFRA